MMRQIGEWGGPPPGGVQSPKGSTRKHEKGPPPGNYSCATGRTPSPASITRFHNSAGGECEVEVVGGRGVPELIVGFIEGKRKIEDGSQPHRSGRGEIRWGEFAANPSLPPRCDFTI